MTPWPVVIRKCVQCQIRTWSFWEGHLVDQRIQMTEVQTTDSPLYPDTHWPLLPWTATFNTLTYIPWISWPSNAHCIIVLPGEFPKENKWCKVFACPGCPPQLHFLCMCHSEQASIRTEYNVIHNTFEVEVVKHSCSVEINQQTPTIYAEEHAPLSRLRVWPCRSDCETTAVSEISAYTIRDTALEKDSTPKHNCQVHANTCQLCI